MLVGVLAGSAGWASAAAAQTPPSQKFPAPRLAAGGSVAPAANVYIDPACSRAVNLDGTARAFSRLLPLPGRLPGAPVYPRTSGHIPYGFNNPTLTWKDAKAATPLADAVELTQRIGGNIHRTALALTDVLESSAQYPGWTRLCITRWDDIYRVLTEAGHRPLFQIYGLSNAMAPAGARSHGCSKDPARAGDYCQAMPSTAALPLYLAIARIVAHRYPLAAGIEIQNEPNLANATGGDPDPRRYAVVVDETARAIKDVRPAMRTLGFALSGGELRTCWQEHDKSLNCVTDEAWRSCFYAGSTACNRKPDDAEEPDWGWRVSMGTFIREARLVRPGLLEKLDAVSFHPATPTVDPAGTDRSFDQLLGAIPSATRLVVTEYASNGDDPQHQAAVLLNRFRDFDERRPGISGVHRVDMALIHTLSLPDGFNLLKRVTPSSGTTDQWWPKPAYCAIRRHVIGAWTFCGTTPVGPPDEY